MDARVPVTIEKTNTPKLIRRMQYNFSEGVAPEKSPYPTVVMVVTTK